MASGAQIIEALEAAWEDIRAVHPDVPGVIMITGTARQGKREMLTLGHFGADRWRTTADGRLPELFLAGELLTEQDGATAGRRALETLLHEAAHGMAHKRGIADTSRQGRYHSKKFVQLAAELGLSAPDKPHPTIGWSECTLGDETAALWAPTIARIDAAALPFLDGVRVASEGTEEGKGGRSGTRRSAVCKCDPPRRLSITPKQLDSGPILCGVCREKFEPADDEEEG
jgi:hypothetical protein